MIVGLLFAVIFEAPLAAAGVAGAAVSVPIIIHLLNRRRFKIVEWAAMRFLLAAQKKNSRKMRIEQLLLLIVRCLIMLLLVLAMASVTDWAEKLWRWMNPAGGKDWRTGTTRTHKIIVVDGSFSMGMKTGESTFFDNARTLATRIVEGGASGDGYSVVLMGSPPRRIVPEPSEDTRRVAAEIRALKATHGNADLASTLATVAGLLRSSPGKFPAKEVYFLTDMQKSGWLSPGKGDIAGAISAFKQSSARAIFVDAGQEGLSNLAITGMEMGEPVTTTASESRITATLHNYGEPREVMLRLSVGKAREEGRGQAFALRQVAEQRVPVGKGQRPAAFAYRFPEPGDWVVQIAADHDGLDVDDTRSIVVRVRNEVKVLLVNGKPAPELFDRATEWLRVALNPYDEGEKPPTTITARPRVITVAQFENITREEMAPYDAVFVCDVARLGNNAVRRLEDHVRAGGAALFVMGPNVDAGAYNESLWRGGKGLLPAELVGKVSRGGWALQLQMPPGDPSEPLLLFGDEAARARLQQPLFGTYYETRPLRPVAGEVPRAVLNFTPLAISKTPGERPAGGPAMIEWKPPLPEKAAGDAQRDERGASGRGRVVLINTTCNSDWGNWPASPAFPPLMQETMNFAAAARLRERSLLVGQPLEVFLGAMVSGAEASVEAPRDVQDGRADGDDPARRVPVTAMGDGSVLRFVDTETSGIYKVKIGSQHREFLFAVNVPASTSDHQASESNPARATRDDLERSFPDWDLQVVRDLGQVQHATPSSTDSTEIYYAPQGPPVARVLLLFVLGLVLMEVVLAWRFGHYSATASLPQEGPPPKPGFKEFALAASPWVLFAGLAAVAFVLLHNARTGDFLGFLPESTRAFVEGAMNVPPPAPGEGSHWRLEFSSYFSDEKADPWLACTLLVLAGVGIGFIYWQEGNDIPSRFRALLLSLRIGTLLLLLGVFLPQLRLHFERQGWPDVVILIDDSYSMSTLDAYRADGVRQAADGLAEVADLTDEEKEEVARTVASKAGLTKASRLRLAQTLLARGDDWLRDLLERRRVRLHVYRFASRAQRIADATVPAEVEQAGDAIRAIRANPSHDSTEVGTAIRQVLNDFRGSSLAAVIVATDGVSTEGETLEQAAKHARSLNVPLLFVGIGDSHEQRDLVLHDLQAEDSVYVNDRIVFEIKLTAKGFDGINVPVSLYEKGKEKPLDTRPVSIPAGSRTAKVKLYHRPTEAGEKTYVIRVPVQEGEIDKENNQAEKVVHAREAKLLKVLYVEGYRRYEYHYLKTLLERESARVKGNKSVDLKVFLLDADADAPLQDKTMLSGFPTPFRTAETHTDKDDLWTYDVVILGDVSPEPGRESRIAPAQMTQHLKDLAEWVQERGGGLLVMGGERFSPNAYKTSPLKDVLPLDATGDVEDDELIENGYRLELTPAGRMHPMFRFSPDEGENERLWGELKEFFWYAKNYVPKRAAEILALHPTSQAGGKAKAGERHPLILQQFAGSGRCMFFGFSEAWRWNWREHQRHYNQFWMQAIRYLARSKVGRLELRLDRQTPYRRGEAIKMMVRFPEDEKPPPEKTEVKVTVERSPFGKPADKEMRTVQLSRLEGTRGTFEATLTQTPEGEYRFSLSVPEAKPRPRAECKVLAPAGEMEKLRMNEEEMKKAAEQSGGRFYTLETAGRMVDEFPDPERVTTNAPGLPVTVWNSWMLFVLALGLFTVEWLLRKSKNLL